jgi:hypothetical protein
MIQQDQGPTGSGTSRETSDLREQVRGTADDITRQAREVGRGVRDEAANLASSAKEQLVGQAESGKEQVADRISATADRLKRSADDLRGDEAWVANLLDEGVRQLGGLAEGLRNRDLGSLLGSVESFARRQPALFAGASVALGFAAARLAKASAERNRGDYGQGRAETGYPGGTYSGGVGTSGPGQRAYPPAGGTADRMYDRSYGSSDSGASTSGGTGMGGYGTSSTGLSGTGSTTGAGTRDFGTSGTSTTPTSHSLHEDAPGAVGLDRAATSDRWRSADMPGGDANRGPNTGSTTSTGTGSGTGVTP